jgi:hypothetical protein
VKSFWYSIRHSAVSFGFIGNSCGRHETSIVTDSRRTRDIALRSSVYRDNARQPLARAIAVMGERPAAARRPED